MVMAEAMSEEKPGNGWFIPNCDDLHFLFGADNAAARRAVRVPLLQEGDERVNAFQVRTRHGTVDPLPKYLLSVRPSIVNSLFSIVNIQLAHYLRTSLLAGN